jgi:hypothetical protein
VGACGTGGDGIVAAGGTEELLLLMLVARVETFGDRSGNIGVTRIVS